MPAKNKPRISNEQKKSIFALRVQGLSNAQIGERLGLHPVSVSRAYTEVKNAGERAELVPVGKVTYLPAPNAIGETKPDAFKEQDSLINYKNRIVTKSIKALDRGLDCMDDPYKSAALGVSVLKETETLKNSADDDEILRTLARMNTELPPDMQFDLTGTKLPPEPPPRLLSDAEHEIWGLEVFRNSGWSPAEFSRERQLARQGDRYLVSNNEELEEFFRAEELRAKRRDSECS